MTNATRRLRFSSLLARRETLRGQWLAGVSAGVVLHGISLILAFGSGVLAARLLGPESLGQYAFVLAVVGVLAVPAMLGLPAVVARYLAVYGNNGEWGLASGLLRRANQLVALTGLPLGLGLALIGVYAWSGERLGLYAAAAPLIAILAWTSIRQKALQGLHHPVAAQLPEQLFKHSGFLLIACALWWTDSRFVQSPQGLMGIWLIACCLAFAAGAFLLRRLSRRELKKAEPAYDTRLWMAAALPLLLADSVGVVYGSTDIVILGLSRAEEEVGFYQVATKTAGLVAAFLTASNWVLAPWFARLHAEGDLHRLQRLVTRTIRSVFVVTLVIFLIFTLWGRDLLQVFFGADFTAAHEPLLILAAARVFDVAAGPVIVLLAMTGAQRILSWTIAGSAVLNIVGCLLLIPKFGMLGAATSTAFAIVATNCFLAIVVRRHLGIRSSVLG